MKSLRIYKPRNGEGVAAEFQAVRKDYVDKNDRKFYEWMVFLILAKEGPKSEDGNASFHWKDKAQSINVKISELDAAKLLKVFVGLTKEEKLYHDTSKSASGEQNQGVNKAITLSKGDNGFFLRVSTSKENAYQIGVSPEEAIQVKIFLEEFIRRYYFE